MAEDINHVVLVGRLTRDAELRYTPGGFAICKLSLAVNRRRKQGDQWIEEGNFFDANLYGKRGESLNPYLRKGQQVALEGQLKQERWEQQDGSKRSKVVIEAQNIQLLGGRSGGGPSGGVDSAPQQYSNSVQSQGAPSQGGNYSSPSYTPADDDRFEDDVPF